MGENLCKGDNVSAGLERLYETRNRGGTITRVISLESKQV